MLPPLEMTGWRSCLKAAIRLFDVSLAAKPRDLNSLHSILNSSNLSALYLLPKIPDIILHHFPVLASHPGGAGGLVEVFAALWFYEGHVFPGGCFLDGGVFFHHRPVLDPAVPGFRMAGEVDDDLVLIVFVHRLLLEEGLPVQVVEVVVLLFNIEALTIEHLIVNVLIMVRKRLPTRFTFSCARRTMSSKQPCSIHGPRFISIIPALK